MKACENCGALYDDICSNCNENIVNIVSDKEIDINLFPFENADTAKNNYYDPLRVTVTNKILGFCSAAGIIVAIVLTAIFSEKLYYVPGKIVMASRQNYFLEIEPVLYLSIILFAVCFFYALFPRFFWSLEVQRIQRRANVDSDIEPSDSWFAIRGLSIFAAFVGALAALVISTTMFYSALEKTKRMRSSSSTCTKYIMVLTKSFILPIFK